MTRPWLNRQELRAYRQWANEHIYAWSSERPVSIAHAREAFPLYLKSTDKATAASYVFAAVILISNTKKSGFGYKDMTESMGPCQCDCLDPIMRLLTPITDLPNPGYAAEWRARVEARKNAKRQQRERRQLLRIGSIVTLPSAASFRGGFTASRFRVAHFRRRTPVFEALDPPGFLCRLPAATLAAATIAAPQDADLDRGGV